MKAPAIKVKIYIKRLADITGLNKMAIQTNFASKLIWYNSHLI
jgi:hypothetical protein